MTKDEFKECKKKYLKSKEWKHVREAVLERDGYRCRVTGKTKEDGAILVVHHTAYRHYGEGSQEEIDDCITLEKYTHLAIHRVKGNMRWFSIENDRNKNGK